MRSQVHRSNCTPEYLLGKHKKPLKRLKYSAAWLGFEALADTVQCLAVQNKSDQTKNMKLQVTQKYRWSHAEHYYAAIISP